MSKMPGAAPVEKTFGFGLVGMKKFPELIPLVGAISLALGLAVTYMGYSLLTKSDITINKYSAPRFERVNPEQPQKLVTFNTKYQKIPELELLRKEIGSFRAK